MWQRAVSGRGGLARQLLSRDPPFRRGSAWPETDAAGGEQRTTTVSVTVGRKRMAKQTTPHNRSVPYRTLPLFLYDLSSASRLLPPAAVLPEQFHGSPGDSGTAEREKALMRAVLEDAIKCVQKPAGHNTREHQRLAREAMQWLLADDQHWPFSFVNICAVLGLEAGYVRQGLKPRWQPLLDHAKAKRPRKAAGRDLAPLAA